MKEKSVFLEREGYTPKNKVLDFLIVAQDFDYSLKEIAKFSKVSYPCIKQLKKELVKDRWITLTRKVGKSQMYKLNIKNPVVKKFIEFYWEVIENEIQRREKVPVKEDLKSGSSVGGWRFRRGMFKIPSLALKKYYLNTCVALHSERSHTIPIPVET